MRINVLYVIVDPNFEARVDILVRDMKDLKNEVAIPVKM